MTQLYTAGMLAALLLACGDKATDTEKDSSRQMTVERKTEQALQFPQGLEESVEVDSVTWDVAFTSSDTVVIEYFIAFRNRTDKEVETLYELHFLDGDYGLVDTYKPLGQPLCLPPRQAREESGDLALAIPNPDDLRFSSTMQVVAQIRNPVRNTEIALEYAPGLEQPVEVDSVGWDLGPYDLAVSDEMSGQFHIVFRNLVDQDVEVRYDLRFLDKDGFLIDQFIPFGLPLRIDSGQIHEARGEFFVRARPLEIERCLISVLQVVVRIEAAQ